MANLSPKADRNSHPSVGMSMRMIRQKAKLQTTCQILGDAIPEKLEGFTPYENALCVDLTFYLGIPTSWSKQKRIQASQGVIRPIKKPDTDNLIKSVTDACSGLLWVDDCIITDISARKRYTADLARVVLKVTEH